MRRDRGACWETLNPRAKRSSFKTHGEVGCLLIERLSFSLPCNPLPRLTSGSHGDRTKPRNVPTLLVPFAVMATLMVMAIIREQWPWQHQGQQHHTPSWRLVYPQRRGAHGTPVAPLLPLPLMGVTKATLQGPSVRRRK